MTVATAGYAAAAPGADFTPISYELRDLRDIDVLVDVHFCGICTGDIIFRDMPMFGTQYPYVPGHEMAGVVSRVGPKVTTLKPGDRVGVGCFAHCCNECEFCKAGTVQFCPKVCFTVMPDGEPIRGGFGKQVVCEEQFVFRIPDQLPLEAAGPLLCAGIVTYSPAKHLGWHKGGLSVGVVGLGGLGHMAVQWAKAMGNSVTLITRNMDKAEEAKKLGVDKIIVSSDEEALKAAAGSLHHILDTAGNPDVISKMYKLLQPEGTIVLVAPDAHGGSQSMPISTLPLIIGGVRIMGSRSGSLPEHYEMLEYAASHNIRPVVEIIKAENLKEQLVRLQAGTVKFKLVIDTRASKYE